MICVCGRPVEAPRRKWCSDACRAQRSPSKAANRKGRNLAGELRPSRKRNRKGLRADGTKRPSRIAHETKNHAERQRWGGEHTQVSRLERPFWMIDGEGAGEGEAHEYLLLGSGDRMLRVRWDGVYWAYRTLDFSTCLSFLAATIPDDVEPFTYGGDYDVTMWVRSLPREVLVSLMDREGRTDPAQPWRPRPVKVQGFEIDWLPGHFFWFRSPSGRKVRISDVRRFFGGSFVSAVASQGIEVPQWAIDMKRQRPHFTREEVLGPEVARYNTWEHEAGAAMMTSFRQRCIDVGVVPRHWEGPGQGATAIMAAMNIKDHLSGGFER